MRHKVSGRKLGRRADHRKAMIKNLAESLILHGRIETTVTRAKEVRRYVEKLITRAGKGDLHSRRLVLSRLHTKEAVSKLFDEIAPRYVDRPGGYTRILKTRARRGDATEMAIIELVEEEMKKKKKKKPAKKTQAKSAAKEVSKEQPAEETKSEAAEPAKEEAASDDAQATEAQAEETEEAGAAAEETSEPEQSTEADETAEAESDDEQASDETAAEESEPSSDDADASSDEEETKE